MMHTFLSLKSLPSIQLAGTIFLGFFLTKITGKLVLSEGCGNGYSAHLQSCQRLSLRYQADRHGSAMADNNPGRFKQIFVEVPIGDLTGAQFETAFQMGYAVYFKGYVFPIHFSLLFQPPQLSCGV
jgi:hypothetical protein